MIFEYLYRVIFVSKVLVYINENLSMAKGLYFLVIELGNTVFLFIANNMCFYVWI